jgi:Flp pilus assembly protein, protease CpaA
MISLLGFLSGLVILIIPFALKGIGAGDVKLLALIGAIKGSTFAFNTAIYMFVIGGVIAFIIVLFHRETINFFKSIFYFLVGLVMGRIYSLELPTTPLVKKFPYSSAIAGGAMISLLIKGAAIL